MSTMWSTHPKCALQVAVVAALWLTTAASTSGPPAYSANTNNNLVTTHTLSFASTEYVTTFLSKAADTSELLVTDTTTFVQDTSQLLVTDTTTFVQLSGSEAAASIIPSSHITNPPISNSQTAFLSVPNIDTSTILLSSTYTVAVLLSNSNTETTSLPNTEVTTTLFSDLEHVSASLSHQATIATSFSASDNTKASVPNTESTSPLSVTKTPFILPYTEAINTDLSNKPSGTDVSNLHTTQTPILHTEATNTVLSSKQASSTHLSNIQATQTLMLHTEAGSTLLFTIEDTSSLLSASVTPSHTNTFSSTPSNTTIFSSTSSNTNTFSLTPSNTNTFSPTPSNTNTFSSTLSHDYTTSSVDSNSTNELTGGTTGAATSAPSKSPTTVSRPEVTVPPPYSIVPNISFPFQLKYDKEFHKDLEDPTSVYYKEAVTNYTQKLTQAYTNVTGFQYITIKKFWKGSVGVDYVVVIAYNLTHEQFDKEMWTIVYPAFSVSEGVNKSFLEKTFNESIQQALGVLKDVCSTSSKMCRSEYHCLLDENSKPQCHPLCTDTKAISKCENGGYCVQDAPNNFVCSCPEDKTYLYGGPYCEIKAEKLDMKKDYIIAIACGAGGGIILILIIVIIILNRRRESNKQTRNDKDNASEQSFKSIKDSEDGLHQSFTGNRSSSLLDYSNPTFRRPEERAEYMRLNPHLSTASGQPQVTSPLSVTSRSGLSHLRQTGHEMETAKLGSTHSQVSQERTPNRDQPAMYPHLSSIHPTADYVEIDDNFSKSVMYQPTRAMRPLPEFQQGRPLHSPSDTKVYDYTGRVEPAESSRRSQDGSGFYSFDYENSTDRGSRVNDPYSIKRPHIASQKRFS